MAVIFCPGSSILKKYKYLFGALYYNIYTINNRDRHGRVMNNTVARLHRGRKYNDRPDPSMFNPLYFQEMFIFPVEDFHCFLGFFKDFEFDILICKTRSLWDKSLKRELMSGSSLPTMISWPPSKTRTQSSTQCTPYNIKLHTRKCPYPDFLSQPRTSTRLQQSSTLIQVFQTSYRLPYNALEIMSCECHLLTNLIFTH